MTDTPDRRERLLNLLAALLNTDRGFTRDDLISNSSIGYPAGDSARRAFERDKASLRAMGVPLTDEAQGNEIRYRVKTSEYYLPPLALTDEELAALHIAVTAIGIDDAASEGALMKLGGFTGEGSAPIAVLPHAPQLVPLFEASRNRSVVTFDYHGRSRRLEPWGLTSKFGNWYVVGLEPDLQDMRVFRIDRIENEISAGAPNKFTVPSDFLPGSYLDEQPWEYGGGRTTAVRIRVDPGHAASFAARGEADDIQSEPDGSAVITLRVVDMNAMRDFVLGFVEHAEVLDPPEARAAVIDWLTELSLSVKDDE